MHTKDVKKLPVESNFSWGTITIVPLMVTFSMLLNGFTLMKLWEWFVMPVAPVLGLTLSGAVGLIILIGFLTGDTEIIDGMGTGEGEPVGAFVKKTFYSGAKSAACLIAGWLIHVFAQIFTA